MDENEHHEHEAEYGEGGREAGELAGHAVGTLLEEALGPSPAYVLGQMGGDFGEVAGQFVGATVDAAENLYDWASTPPDDPYGGTLPDGGAPPDTSPDGGVEE